MTGNSWACPGRLRHFDKAHPIGFRGNPYLCNQLSDALERLVKITLRSPLST